MNVLRNDRQQLISLVEQSARPAGPWGLRLHLTPPTGWLNDPNGLCYFRGEYHVFYQYSPFNVNGGVRFWGHYKSRDLLSWEQCPVMLCPDSPGDVHGAYSGSALCGEDGLYLYYTGSVKHEGDFDYIHAGRESNTLLAYSADGVHLDWKRLLMRNTDYPAGLTLHVRDPKVWKQDGQYYMVQGVRTEQNQGAAIVFTSEDKLRWKHIRTLHTAQPFGYMWECPDLVEFDGQQFLLASPQGVRNGQPGFENQYACGYFPLAGDFRGEYTLGDFVPLDYGFDFYAPQTFSDGKRRLLIGWMGMPDAEYTNPTAAAGWQHCLTVPRELRREGGRLLLRPVPELELLREDGKVLRFDGQASVRLPAVCELVLSCEGMLSLDLSGVRLTAEAGKLTLTIQRGGYGRTTRTAPVKTLRGLRILVDTSALEIFVNDGEAVLTTRWYPEGTDRTLTIHGTGQAVLYGLRPLQLKKKCV